MAASGWSKRRRLLPKRLPEGTISPHADELKQCRGAHGLVSHADAVVVLAPAPPSIEAIMAEPAVEAAEYCLHSVRLVPVQAALSHTVLCGHCWVIDEDTIVIDNVHLRLAGIDAPELDHQWGQRAKGTLIQLCKGQKVTAVLRPELSYDRLVAECFLPDGRDLSAELVRTGLALDWAKYSGGKYRHLEPSDARRKLWRAAARQWGLLRPGV